MKTIKLGQIFSLGTHRLICGDATDQNITNKLINQNKIQMILTDPPYGVAYVASKKDFTSTDKHKDIANDHAQTETNYRQFTARWLRTSVPHLANRNSVYIFNSDKMLFALRDGMRDGSIKFGQLLVWIKTQAVIGRMDYLPQHELIAYGWHSRHKFFKSKDKSILVYPRTKKNNLHPTMKPIGLLRRLILNSSSLNDFIYDPFGGSGSTLIACEQTKRRCLMVELDPDYCQTIIDRYEKFTNKKAKKLNQCT